MGDFNRDGKPDLAVAELAGNGIGAVKILLGDGNGRLTEASSVDGDNLVSVGLADFNGDGKLDVAAASYGSASIRLLQGDGNGGLSAGAILPGGGFPKSVAVVADFNGDGKQDLAMTNFADSTVSVLLQA